MEPNVVDSETKVALSKGEELQLAQLLRAVRCPFGPQFFFEQLAAFVRDRCPDPGEQLPRVDLWYLGEPLALCHVVAVAPSWVAVAVRDRHAHDSEMRTELFPYEAISRVTIGAPVSRSRGMGFDCAHRPEIVEEQPPTRLLAVAGRPSLEQPEGQPTAASQTEVSRTSSTFTAPSVPDS
jgi:hypothetical protein